MKLRQVTLAASLQTPAAVPAESAIASHNGRRRMRVLLYYKYVPVDDPDSAMRWQRSLCERLHLKGRILISGDGINGTCCGDRESIELYKQSMDEHAAFYGIHYKESDADTQVFPKLIVKVKPELVMLRGKVDLRKRATYITAKELHEALERNDDLVLVDMRNDFEAAIGRFKNAVAIPMRNFRDLPALIEYLQPYKERRIVTYCTGGIRCETASALLHQHGFKNVAQLEGGIVTYCERYPDGFFEGTCFVFDDRMAVRFESRGKERILSTCTHCHTPCDRYIDCECMPCNKLFLCCERCEKAKQRLCDELHVTMPTHAVC